MMVEAQGSHQKFKPGKTQSNRRPFDVEGSLTYDGAPEFSREVWTTNMTGFKKGIFKNNIISDHFLPPGNI